MDRNELLQVTAKRYAEVQLELEEADRTASKAQTSAANLRADRDCIEKELRGHVGRNAPTKIVIVPEHKRAVLIQMDLRAADQPVYVSLSETL